MGQRDIVTEHCTRCGLDTEHTDDGVTLECTKCGESIPSPD